MGSEENIRAFRDTERLCKENHTLQNSIAKSVMKQRMIKEGEELTDISKIIYQEPADIVVSKKKSLEAAAAYKYNWVCVHNFASATEPGGGVISGASAQEECLCRCSSLYACINSEEMQEKFYNPHREMQNFLYNDDIIYTPFVMVFKTDTEDPELLPEDNWYKVNVVSCSAPDLRAHPSSRVFIKGGDKARKLTKRELQEIHERRLRRILDVAIMGKNDVVILGAFGCGAFKNNPRIVAAAAKKVIKEYRHAFVTIEFAVYCSPWDSKNYQIFKRVLEKS